MKNFVVASSILIAAVAAAPAPTDYKVDYDKVDYSNVDYSKVDFDKVDYSNVDYSKVDFDNVKYPPGTGAQPPKDYPSPDGYQPNYSKFTSTFHVIATPDQVVNGTTPTGGQKGAMGYYDLALNSHENFICYKIVLTGLGAADYQSAASTSTHIHEATRGQSGPPRIAFPNPAYVGDHERISEGCLKAPFSTGLLDAAGVDTGRDFHVSEIEKNPHAFFADVHTEVAVPGAVRGQIGE